MYTPKKTKDYEALVKELWCYPIVPKNIAVKLKVVAYFGVAKSGTKKAREQKLNNETPVLKTPDIDNIAKIIQDALNGVAYEDDRQITILECRKLWSEEPRVEVEITKLERNEE